MLFTTPSLLDDVMSVVMPVSVYVLPVCSDSPDGVQVHTAPSAVTFVDICVVVPSIVMS